MSTITLALTSTTVTATGTPLSVTASVTNSATVPARIVLGVFPAVAPAAPPPAPPGAPAPAAPAGAAAAATAAAPPPDPRAWTQVDRPLRVVAPGTTEQFTVTINPPAGTAAGEYGVRFLAYDADRPPEEYNDQAQHLQVMVPAGPAAAKAGIPWWVWVAAAGLVVVIGVVAFFVLRPSPAPPVASPAPTTASASPSPMPNPCPSPYVPRLSRPGDLTCVTALSAAEAQADNDPELQKLRKDPAGIYGPETCVQGYVWRVAYPDDYVCVTVEVRTRTYWENQGNPLGTP